MRVSTPRWGRSIVGESMVQGDGPESSICFNGSTVVAVVEGGRTAVLDEAGAWVVIIPCVWFDGAGEPFRLGGFDE